MRKSILCGVLLLTTTTFTHAADMSAGFEAGDASQWGGWYAGLQTGWAWAKANDNSGSPSTSLNGGLIGGFGGYNFVMDNVVLGLELDANYLDLNRRNSSNIRVRSNWSVGASARVGYAFESLLPYARIGVGLQDGYIKSYTSGLSDDITYHYFEFGGGLEVEVAENVSVRAEVLHRISDEQKYNLVGSYKSDMSNTQLRVGVSYHY